MQHDDAQSLAFGLLAASRALVDGVSAGVRARGFDDVRPAEGFAFARLSFGGATITQLAEHLDVTRQAAAQLVDELIAKGYVARRPHPSDARARLIVLTEKGWACTRAAEAATADTLRPWEAALGTEGLLALRDYLLAVAPAGPVRPTW
jgi:DNA-binding MarR family transcriptional regulator